MSRRTYEDLFTRTACFTRSTRTRLERAVGSALYGRRCNPVALQSAVHSATRELHVSGLDDETTLALLGSVVEDAGRSCGADRSSLMSGEPVWLSVQTRVLDSARRELAALAL
jgi:hypothetical protein